jgi:cobaltochelatase CobT
LRMIEEEQEKEQEKSRQQQPRQQGCDDSSLQPQSGQSDADQDLSADSKPDNPDQDQSQGQSSQQSDADGDEQDQQPGQGGSNVTGSTTDHSQSQNSERLAQTLASVLSAGEDDVPDDLFEVVQEILGSQPHHCYDADVHMPLAMDPNRNPSIGNALLNRVLTESGKIRASLQGLVQSSRCERPVTKRSGNRIDGRKLSRLVQGDPRVFVRRHHVKAPNTAIHLLVDGSGSMNNLYDQSSRHRLIDIAMETGMALALALEGISGVNPAVTRFPFGDTDNVVPLLKHGQKVRPNAPAFSAITSGGTPLHTALWYAAASVLATREERKVIMVLTDGQPDDERAAKAIIHRCEATGIELVGVGICYDTSHLFDRSIFINNVSELRSELFRISRELLLAA